MNEQFIYTGGKYREFRGYVFANGNPVTILDRGALEAIRKDATFKQVDQAQEAETIATAETGCPKCGKIIGRGRAIHVKYCKG
jgi:hypothetical protein